MELKFIERPKRNPITGRFLKGVAPHNKGKKWSDYMDGRKRNKVLKCLQRIGNPNLAGSAGCGYLPKNSNRSTKQKELKKRRDGNK